MAQARSLASKQALVQSAIALWRTRGFANTTIAEICRAAGVSKALFYFYFRGREDVLLEAGLVSTHEAQQMAQQLMRKPYDLADVIRAVLTVIENHLKPNPPELVIEAVLEGYRQSYRAATQPEMFQGHASLFLDVLRQASRDDKIPAGVDVQRLALVVDSLVPDGVRHWVAGLYGDQSFTDAVAQDIEAAIRGYLPAPSGQHRG